MVGKVTVGGFAPIWRETTDSFLMKSEDFEIRLADG